MKIIVANWKMNGDLDLVSAFIERINAIETKNTIVVCPPAALIREFNDFHHLIGAQNCFYEDKGAFTGENSPKLLKKLGCGCVIIGHSERRALFGETDEIVFKKHEAALRNELIPIVCIGEKANERVQWKHVLTKQIEKFIGAPLQNTIFAYEPVWSIGTGMIPTTEEIQEALAFIKNKLGRNVPCLYGGSVNASNAESILKVDTVDGLLIGGASLKPDEFAKITMM
ncbi:MAG: triose-phosphate isomerase [Alphaproteobacteria bacterium]|nr:triose-phosphate isomerase [Alphaproteobacteria bacterium]